MSCFGRQRKLTSKDIGLPTGARTINRNSQEWKQLDPALQKEIGVGARPVRTREDILKDVETNDIAQEQKPVRKFRPNPWTPEAARQEIKLLPPPFVEPVDPNKTYPKPPISTWEYLMNAPVHELDYQSFKQFLPAHKMAYVVYYDLNDSQSQIMAGKIKKAINSSEGGPLKGVYTAVNCAKNHHLCLDENIPAVPYLKLYSYGTFVNAYTVWDFDFTWLEKNIEYLPDLEQVTRPERPCELAAAADADKKKPGTPGAQKKHVTSGSPKKPTPATPNKK